ncbi:very-long-chain (3R)-3-hydroxyacyl-CoA dehydratase 1 isoform X2 [Pogona vitticeps]
MSRCPGAAARRGVGEKRPSRLQLSVLPPPGPLPRLLPASLFLSFYLPGLRRKGRGKSHGVQRRGRRRRRQQLVGREGERQEGQAVAGRGDHRLAHLLQHHHDRGIVHCAIVVHTSVLVTGVQVSSRIFMVWFITHSIKQIQNEESVILFLVVWTVTEITRYSFYTFNMLNHLPYFIKWARYNFFIILYPVGVVGELLTIYTALPYVKRSGMYSVRLPNKYNVSFDYYYFLLIVMVSYVPLFPQLYFHMLRQRRRVLHGEVIVEKDD